MTISTETLMAYVDGELSSDETHAVEAELAKNAELRTYVDRQRALARRLHDSMDMVLDAPLPESVLQMIETSAPARPFAAWRKLIAWTALPAAVALACGVLIGVVVHGNPDIALMNGALIAHGRLATALTEQVASDPNAEVGISFRDRTGHYCRTFAIAGASPVAGVACHRQGAWHIAAVGNIPAEPSGPYTPAASTMPDFVRSAVSGLISGQPLDLQGERKARAAGWR